MSQDSNYIFGRNSVKSAIKSGAQIDRIYVIEGVSDGSIKEIVSIAKAHKIPIKETSRSKLDHLCKDLGHNNRPANHQGIVAQIPAFEYGTIEDALNLALKRNQPPFFVVLDAIQDPHNLGAIIRNAESMGAHGVIIGKNRSVSLTGAAFKVSSGAAAYIPIIKVTNINNTLNDLKKQNIWVAAADMSGEPAYDANLKGALALVIGGEGKGVSRLIKENADIIIGIPTQGETESLNAACSAAILIYEKRRQDLCN